MGPLHRQSAVREPHASHIRLVPGNLPQGPVPAAEEGASKGAFETVYRTHAKTVARWALRLLGPGADVEDVVQDVFLVVRRKLPGFRGEAELSTWLYEITVRVAHDTRRRRRWWAWLSGRGQNPGRGQARPESPPEPEAPRDPQELLEARERTRLLYRVLDDLGEAYRTTFILFELEGLSGERIAEITGTRVGTVWVRLSRARRKFIQRMRAWEEEDKP